MKCDIHNIELPDSELHEVKSKYRTSNIRWICIDCKTRINTYQDSLKDAPLATEIRLTKNYMENLKP
jgi:hypothetical protein